jgi:hypothetical protein
LEGLQGLAPTLGQFVLKILVDFGPKIRRVYGHPNVSLSFLNLIFFKLNNSYFTISNTMYIIVIAWIYVTLMMSVAEANNTNGTLLGAIVTFILYGILPTALMVYLMGAPKRNKARKAKEAAWATPKNTEDSDSALPVEPDASGHTARVPPNSRVPPMRKKQ